jgi:hypothetical protein
MNADKKLTDSEIIKALNTALGMEHISIYCANIKNEVQTIRVLDIIDLINRLQAENERLKEPTSASAIHILAEKAVEALQKENEEHKTEIMRLEHNVRVLSENSIIAKYPHHWLLDEGWFLSKELDGYGKFKAQVSNEAIIGFVGRLKAKAEVFPELRLIVIKEKDWDNLLKELVGEDK